MPPAPRPPAPRVPAPRVPAPRVPAPRPVVAPEDALARVTEFADTLQRRRTVRDFDTRPIPEGVLEQAIRAAASAPSGAHVQPWRFVVVTDPALRQRIRAAAEA